MMGTTNLEYQASATPQETALQEQASTLTPEFTGVEPSGAAMTSVGSCRILIADDHPVFRYGVRALLEAEPGFTVVGEATYGGQVLELVTRLVPDILLLDLAMPNCSGLDVLRDLTKAFSPVRIIVLAATIHRDDMVEALQLGARGIVSKESASDMLIESVRAVLGGQYWVGRENVSGLVKALREALPRPGEKARAKNFGLTAREIEIMTAIVAGYSNKEIAYKFSISEQTVKHHITNIFDKFGVSSRLELALFAVNHHLVVE